MTDPVRTSIDGRIVALTNLDKPLYSDGFTKGEVIAYYLEVAPVLLRHLAGKAITRVRFPEGTDAASFFEKNAPSGTPDWVPIITVATSAEPVHYVSADEPATLVWLAQTAALELHTPQWRRQHCPGEPVVLEGPAEPRADSLVIDLDPGAGVTMPGSAKAALLAATMLADDSLTPLVKTSGQKGLQLLVPLVPTPASRVVAYAKSVAERLAMAHPDIFVATSAIAARTGKVLVDYLQNLSARNTVSVYSLRGTPTPRVSTPVTWDEVGAVEREDDLRFSPEDALARLRDHGDLWGDALDAAQACELPEPHGGR